MTRFFNLKTNQGTETVDELSLKDFATRKEYFAELKRLRNEYHLAGMAVYTSQRCTKEWSNK